MFRRQIVLKLILMIFTFDTIINVSLITCFCSVMNTWLKWYILSEGDAGAEEPPPLYSLPAQLLDMYCCLAPRLPLICSHQSNAYSLVLFSVFFVSCFCQTVCFHKPMKTLLWKKEERIMQLLLPSSNPWFNLSHTHSHTHTSKKKALLSTRCSLSWND